jgi:hypothetical protein
VDVYKMMNQVMIKMQGAALNTYQRMKQSALLEAREKWNILRGSNEIDYLVWRFFPKDSKFQ